MHSGAACLQVPIGWNAEHSYCWCVCTQRPMSSLCHVFLSGPCRSALSPQLVSFCVAVVTVTHSVMRTRAVGPVPDYNLREVGGFAPHILNFGTSWGSQLRAPAYLPTGIHWQNGRLWERVWTSCWADLCFYVNPCRYGRLMLCVWMHVEDRKCRSAHCIPSDWVTSRPILGPTQPPLRLVPGVKWPGRDADHSPRSTVHGAVPPLPYTSWRGI
jgi:hypothetical protein